MKNDIINYIKRLRANYFINKISKIECSLRTINVCFIVQMPEIWDKEAPVFESMLLDKRFNAVLLVIPSYDISLGKVSDYGFELDYFVNKYGNQAVIKAYNGGVWFDLSNKEFDYVFYQRCWEYCIPEQYHTKNVIRYAKTCYIPYAVGLKDGYEYYKSDFFMYLYLCFCATREQIEFHDKSLKKKVVFCGYPVIENIINSNCNSTSNTSKTILWTPRWTDDPFFGGSSFVKYMYNILDLKKSHKNINLILRPHPMTFKHLIKEGKLSEEEVVDFKYLVERNNSCFDSNVFIEDTLQNTDILITDYSSIVLDFFVTGKPIIYCTDINVDFEAVYKCMSKTFYLANNWDDVSRFVDDLLSGNDPLFSERQQLAEQVINENLNATNNILSYIVSDFERFNICR